MDSCFCGHTKRMMKVVSNIYKKFKNFIWSKNFVLLLIVLLALILRLNALNFGLFTPVPFDDSEASHINTALRMFENKTLSANIITNNYAPFLSYVDATIFAPALLFSLIFGFFGNINELKEYFILDRTILVFLSRIMVALFSALTVYAIYRAGKKFFNSAIGIISALFFSVELINVVIAHKAIAWVPMLLFLVFALEQAGEVFETGRSRAYFLSTFFAVLSFASHMIGGIVIIPLIAAHFLRQKKIISLKSIFNTKLILAGIFFLCGLCIIFAVNPTALLWELNGQYTFEEHGFLDVFKTPYEPFYYSIKFLFILHPLLSLSALLGIALMLWQKQSKKLLLILSLPFFYYLYIGPLTCSFQARFFIIFIPFLILLGSFGFCALINMIKTSQGKKKILIILLVTAVISPSAYAAILWSKDIRQKSPNELAQNWINENLPENSKILINSLGGPMFLEENKEFLEFRKDTFGEESLTFRQNFIFNLENNKRLLPAFFPLSITHMPIEKWEEILKEYKFEYYILLNRAGEYYPHALAPTLQEKELVKEFVKLYDSEDIPFGRLNSYLHSIKKITGFWDIFGNSIKIYKLK